MLPYSKLFMNIKAGKGVWFAWVQTFDSAHSWYCDVKQRFLGRKMYYACGVGVQSAVVNSSTSDSNLFRTLSEFSARQVADNILHESPQNRHWVYVGELLRHLGNILYLMGSSSRLGC